jgi:uncharacterized protein (DUF3084 family)
MTNGNEQGKSAFDEIWKILREVAARDEALAARQEALAARQEALAARDEALASRDESIERRHEALAQSVELLSAMHRDNEQQLARHENTLGMTQQLLAEAASHINALARIAESHQHRLDDLEGQP